MSKIRSQKSEVSSQKLEAAAKKLKPGYTLCLDCARPYKIGAPHMMFCEAHTCEQCGTSFSTALAKDSEGKRICDTCLFSEEEEES